MNGRVAELAVRYRVPRGASIAAAQVPLLERTMRMGLASQVAEQIDAIADAEHEVVVLREATARVTLRPSDWSLDHAMLERVGRAAREAVIARLARPPGDDDMMRFASEAEFAGTFVVDLLGGTAWDRWYFGAFRRFRRSGTRETLERLLADSEIDRGSLFAWLEARGKLAEVLRLVGPSHARPAPGADASREPAPPADLGPLALAAFAIVEALGPAVTHEREAALLPEYYATHPDRPAWDDRAALTSWVWAFARWTLAREAGGNSTPGPGTPEMDALHELLGQRLDWLDGQWLQRRAAAEWPAEPTHSALPGRAGAGPAVAPRHAALLARLAALVRQGTTRLDRLGESRDQLVVRMIAALEASGELDGARDRAFVAALEQICEAWQHGAEMRPALVAEPAVAELGAELAKASRDAAGGIETPGAGLYLLARAVSDLRLVALAERATVPREPLLGALARKLLGIRQPFDGAVAAWVGADDPSLGALEPEPLWLLQELLQDRLFDQGHIERTPCAVHEFTWRDQPFVALSDAKGTCWPLARPSSADVPARLLQAWTGETEIPPAVLSAPRGPVADLEQLAPLDELPPAVEVAVTSVASGLLRAWGRWLPGIGGSSMPFLVRTCLTRGGCVRLDAALADVVLDPAPLDSVLELAGYLKPMESARWLGRRVRFSIARSRR